MELVCPAGSMPALKAAVDNGADAVYLGFRDGTNARNFPGLNYRVRATVSPVKPALRPFFASFRHLLLIQVMVFRWTGAIFGTYFHRPCGNHA